MQKAKTSIGTGENIDPKSMLKKTVLGEFEVFEKKFGHSDWLKHEKVLENLYKSR